MELFDSYLICTSPRSGSTLLCHLLRETRVAGFPGSHFHEPSLKEWLGFYGLVNAPFNTRQDALTAVFKAAYHRGKGESDIFGLRMQRHSFDFFIDQLNILYPSHPDNESRINAAFGKTLFVHLTRQNKLDQAISYVKAKQSGLWHMARDGTELERLSDPKEPTYDAAAIAAQLSLSKQMDAAWNLWFASETIEPLRITYNELSEAPYATLDRVLAALGLKAPAKDKTIPPVAKLADAINDEWAARFRSEFPTLDTFLN